MVLFLNPNTCGIYKNGGPRYKVDPATGSRTTEIDNEMADQVGAFLAGKPVPGLVEVAPDDVFRKGVLVPRYYDSRREEPFLALCKAKGWESVSLGDLEDGCVLKFRGGHGSPPNDKRTGHIPYVKVSDIRSLRVNINPTNLVSDVVAQQFWRGPNSGLLAWDLLTPNRASSNIGEFAILLPGEEQVVLTKEVFVVTVVGGQESGWSPFYLLWALCLRAVREQWQRVTLMQTNREDVGKRYREILVPQPESKEWADEVCAAFRDYFTIIAEARTRFRATLNTSGLEYIASALSALPTVSTSNGGEEAADPTEEGISSEQQPDAEPRRARRVRRS